MEKTPSSAVRRYRWERVPAVLWLMLSGSVAGALILIGRTVFLFARPEAVTPDDDLSLTVFLGVLCLFSSTVLGAGAYYLCRPVD